MRLTAEFRPPTMRVEIQPGAMSASTGTPVVRELVEREPYEGSYEVTPSAETQTLSTRNLRMTDNITINPIPSNYGLITWDGSTLTVS